MADLSEAGAKKKKLITIVILVCVVGFIAWEAMGMFSNNDSSGGAAITSSAQTTQASANKGPQTPPAPPKVTPVPAELPKQPPALSEREIQLMQLQQETEAKYVAAVNELQMLKVQKDIAETNKAIVSAKLDTVNAEKSIVDALTVQPVPQASYSQSLATPGAPTAAAPAVATNEITYTVISVSRVQYKWNAVLGYQGNLYSVSVGDMLPPDSSKVVSIDRGGVTLEKDGVKKKVSLVPII